MVGYVQKPLWLAMACAAFVAQVVPQAWGGDCDHGCCAAEVRDCCVVTVGHAASDTRAERSVVPAGCPLCAAPAGGEPTRAVESPCHCQLDARQEQPLSVRGESMPQRDDLSAWVALDAASSQAPHGVGVNWSYQAASRSIPIRPMRILYGVWRN